MLEPLTDLKAIVCRYGRTHAIVGNADTRVNGYHIVQLINGLPESEA